MATDLNLPSLSDEMIQLARDMLKLYVRSKQLQARWDDTKIDQIGLQGLSGIDTVPGTPFDVNAIVGLYDSLTGFVLFMEANSNENRKAANKTAVLAKRDEVG